MVQRVDLGQFLAVFRCPRMARKSGAQQRVRACFPCTDLVQPHRCCCWRSLGIGLVCHPPYWSALSQQQPHSSVGSMNPVLRASPVCALPARVQAGHLLPHLRRYGHMQDVPAQEQPRLLSPQLIKSNPQIFCLRLCVYGPESLPGRHRRCKEWSASRRMN